MKTNQIKLFVASMLAFAASGLRAQTSDAPPPAAGPIPPWQVDVAVPYAIQWHTAGVVADIGANYMGNFLGLEYSYYDANPHGYAFYSQSNGSYQGLVGYRSEISTLNLAYRYTFPLPVALPDVAVGETNPLKIYVGGAAGVGWVTYHPGFASNFIGLPGYSENNSGRFDYNLVAGFQLDLSRNAAFKVGFRYLDIVHTHVFYTSQKVAASAPEAGFSFRF